MGNAHRKTLTYYKFHITRYSETAMSALCSFPKIKSGQRPQEVARLSQSGLYLNDTNGEVEFEQFPMA
jgi:hypothetical protein